MVFHKGPQRTINL